jgi:RHS repeat-associated protein
MKKLTLTIIFVLQYTIILLAQPVNKHVGDVVMPAPQANGLSKYNDIPVDFSTGIPNISIPIHNVVEGPLSIPISLSYHGSGVKVAETSTWVGTGWNLSVGASISRSILGIADDLGGGYYYVGSSIQAMNFNSPTTPPTPANLEMIRSNILDGESDMYSYSIPGYSGKFVFDHNQNVVQIPQQDVKIIVNTNNGFNFIILDPMGNKYTFNEQEKTLNGSGNSYTTTWHVSHVKTADEKYAINFTYLDKTQTNFSPASYQFEYMTSTLSGCNYPFQSESFQGNSAGGTLVETIVNTKVISTITTSTETINFISNTARQDLPSNSGNVLDEVNITSGTNCRKFNFSYDYFTDNASAPTFPAYAPTAYKRLRLLSLQEKACDNSIVIPPYTFQYNGNFIVNRLSKSIDHWGFHNGATNTGNLNIPQTIFYFFGQQRVHGNANRNSSETPMKDGVLTDINYPTGAKSTFEFEANRVLKSVPTVSSFLSMNNCASPIQGTCCSTTQVVSGPMQLTQNQINTGKIYMNIYDLSHYGQPSCQAGPNIPLLIKLEIKQNNTSGISVGTYSLNHTYTPGSTQPYAQIGDVLLNSHFTLVTNQNYIFILTVQNGKGDITLNQSTSTLQNEIVGGLRIKKITTFDGISPTNNIIKEYDYLKESSTQSSGILKFEPKYLSFGQLWGYAGLRSTAITSQAYADGYHVAYERVSERIVGVGRTIYKYSVVPESPQANIYTNFYPTIPYPYNISNYLENEIQILNESGTILQSNVSNYTNLQSSSISNMWKAQFWSCTNGGTFGLTNIFNYSTGRVRLTSKVFTQDGVQSTSSYTYDASNKHGRAVSESMTNSDGRVHLTEYMYNFDYDNTNGLRDGLISRNIISEPFRTTIKVDNAHVDGSEIGYNWFNLSTGAFSGTSASAFPRKHQLYRYEKTFDAAGNLITTSGGTTLQATLNSYDTYGNISQVTIPNWQPELFEWFSNGLLKKRTFQNHISEYTYHPGTRLIATAKAIDGQITYFEYDKLSRLNKQVQRKVGATENVKVDYTYHYKETSDIYNWLKVKTTYTATANSSLTSRETKEIVDGMGRTIQTIKVNHSPNSKDVVYTKAYDNKGRLWKEFLPVESSGNMGAFFAIPSTTKFTETLYEPSPLNRVQSVTPPGTVGTPGAWYATTYSYGPNTATEVLNLATGSNYSANLLSRVIVTDPNNNRQITFKDKRGRVVMEWQTDVSYANHARTYTMYDNKDRVTTVVPPGATLTTPDLIFKYTYDQDDKVLTKSVPGKGLEKMIYDDRDLVTFYQDAKWLPSNDWLHTKYDVYGRMLNNGRYTHSSAATPSGTLNAAYTDQYKEMSYFTLLTDGVSLGKIKQSKDKILGTANTWIQKDFVYDSYGRVSSVTGSNHLYNNLTAETETFTYDFADNPMTQNRIHKPSATLAEQQTINKRWTYDASGRVKDHFTTLNGVETKISNHNYNFRDELIEKNIGALTPGGTSFLQSIDYAYNDQGWLTRINQPTLTGTEIAFPTICTPAMPNPGVFNASNPDNDVYYMELNYDANTTGITGLPTNQQKSGNISQIAWKVRGRDRQAYNYTYDFLNRLTSSTYYDVNASNAATATNRFNESLTYDSRGNILTLNRTGHYVDASNLCQYGQIDLLGYNYASNTNRLTSLSDGTVLAQAKAKGYNPGTGGVGFGYDAVGNLTSDTYKGITAITYNYLNLPITIAWGTSKSIDFVYDAAGNKLSKTVKTGATINSIQDYVMGVEYNKLGTAARRIESIYHSEGRYFNTSATSTPTWRTEYSIKDHLGNTRLSFTDKNNNGIVDVTNSTSTNDILQENHYYAFGMTHEGPWLINQSAKDNAYQYNGKEFNNDHGLNWSDYGARFYDACIGRWTTVDPLAEVTPNLSPYNYALNNPIAYIDPDGMRAVYNWSTGGYFDDVTGEEKTWDQVRDEYKIGNKSKLKASNKDSEDEPPTILFSNDETSKKYYDFATTGRSDHNEGNGIWNVYSHGGPGFIYDGMTKDWIETAREFDAMMKMVHGAKWIESIKSAAKNKSKVVINLYGCNTAESCTVYRGKEQNGISFAEILSKYYKNVEVNGLGGFGIYTQNANGFVHFSVSDHQGISKGIVTYKNGKIIKQ